MQWELVSICLWMYFARMGEAAHARVLTRHNVDTQAAKLIELFRAVIAQNASARF